MKLNPVSVWRDTRQARSLFYWASADPGQVVLRTKTIENIARDSFSGSIQPGRVEGQFDIGKKHMGQWACRIGYWQGGTLMECTWKRSSDPLWSVALALGSITLDFVYGAGMWGYIVSAILVFIAVVGIFCMYGDWRLRSNGPREVMELLNATVLSEVQSPASINQLQRAT